MIVLIVFFAMALNILLPMIFTPLASEIEKVPPTGCGADLGLKGQIMHNMCHRNQNMLGSTFTTGLIVMLALLLGKYL
jgi:hypothetical protein